MNIRPTSVRPSHPTRIDVEVGGTAFEVSHVHKRDDGEEWLEIPLIQLQGKWWRTKEVLSSAFIAQLERELEEQQREPAE